MTIDEKIEKALKDQDIKNIMNKAASTFHGQLDEDEIHTCKLNALWKSICNHNSKKPAKFTTYLFNVVIIECIREVKFKSKDVSSKSSSRAGERPTPKEINRSRVEELELFDAINSCPDPELLLDRSKGYTIKEISEKHSRNRETVRRKLKNSSKVLRRKLS